MTRLAEAQRERRTSSILTAIILLAGLALAAFALGCGGGSAPSVVVSQPSPPPPPPPPPPGPGVIGAQGSTAAPTMTYYVATNGKDSFSGTLSAPNSAGTDGPFLTLAKAQQAVASAKSKINGSIAIQIRGGTYYLPAPLTFTSTDSGTSSQEIIWEGYPGDSIPLISGGQRLTGWTNVSGNTWTVEIPSSYNNFEALYYNGERRFRPRTTTDYLYLNPVTLSAPTTNCEQAYDGAYRCSDRFSFTPGDLASTYHDINDVEIVSFENWTVSRMRLSSVDTVNNIAYLTGTVSTGTFFGFIAGHRYLVENVQESLSQPGQWYLDRGTTPWTLTYLANPGEDPNTDTVIVPQQPQLIIANGLNYVTFQNLTFSHDDYLVPATGHAGTSGEVRTPAAISFNGSSNIKVTGVTIAHTQGWGIEFEHTVGAGEGNTISACALYDLGTGGVRLGQVPAAGDTSATVAQNNLITGNAVVSGGRFLPGGEGTGIWIGSSHTNEITHNDVHDFYNGAIELGQTPNGGNTYTYDNAIESNMLYDLGQGVTSDMGCLHAASSNNTGNTFVNNVCHDVTHDQSTGGYGGNGIYLDSYTRNVTITNNIVYRVSDTALFLNSGTSGNTVSNNVFAFGREGLIRRGLLGNGGDFTATHNIFYYDIGPIQRLPSNWACPSVCTASFTLDFNDYWQTGGAQPVFVTTVSGNVNAVAAHYDLAQWQAVTKEDLHSVVANPMFVGAMYPTDDYALMSNSPAPSVGFTAISTSGLGPASALGVPATIPVAFPLQLLNPASDF